MTTRPKIVALNTGRPPAPEGLSPAEREEWRVVVGSMPADWLTREAYPLLAGLCRHTVRAEKLGTQINKAEGQLLKDIEGVRVLDKLLAMHERETRAIMALMRSLRLTKQSQYDSRTAARKTGGMVASYYDMDHGEDDDG
jgi:hypothetical protein